MAPGGHQPHDDVGPDHKHRAAHKGCGQKPPVLDPMRTDAKTGKSSYTIEYEAKPLNRSDDDVRTRFDNMGGSLS